jgi:hypothetical protein
MSSNSTDSAIDVSYTPTLEQYFVETGERAQCLSILHSKASIHYAAKDTNINIPIIIISSLTGFFSAGSTSLFPGNMELASILLGISSLVVSVMNTISSYYGFGKKSEGHRIAALSYAKLFRFISVELALPRVERLRATDFLKFVKGEIDRLSETAPFIPKSEVDNFKKLFQEYKDVARPYEANGLTKIKIYKELMTPPLTLRIPPPNTLSSPLPDAEQPRWAERSEGDATDRRGHTNVSGEEHQNTHEQRVVVSEDSG